MNKNQTTCAIIVGSIMLAMLLFPPFLVIREEATYSMGYSFIFTSRSVTETVNTGLLLMQYLIVSSVGAIGWFLLKDKNL